MFGRKDDEGKLRYDLEPRFAREQKMRVITYGAQKYEDRNWELGMKWSRLIAAHKRHFAEFEKCIDFDPETGLLHLAHAGVNIDFLLEYYKIYPQGDDRVHSYLKQPKIGLDIDGVLADWFGHWCRRFGEMPAEFWNFDRHISEKFDLLKDDKEFWLSIPRITQPQELHFEPLCYLTSRSIPNEWTEEWIDINGFPTMPVHTVPRNTSKVERARELGIEIMIDDRYENFVELNSAGICTFLFNAPHNQRYDVGYKRIYKISDIKYA